VPADELSPLVDTLMADVVLHLVEIDVPPRELTRYLVSALRNRARTRHRDARRRELTSEAAYGEYGESTQRIVAECHSEYGLRSALPPDANDGVPLRSIIAKLAEKSAGELGQEDILLMVGVGRHLPLRDIADELGVSYGAVRVRLSRLRERFIKLAIQYARTLGPVEKREIARFFRRAEISLETRGDESKERGKESRSLHSNGDGQ
jgi:DNA-directed RNA polymerase specialized sigma24 family protein